MPPADDPGVRVCELVGSPKPGCKVICRHIKIYCDEGIRMWVWPYLKSGC